MGDLRVGDRVRRRRLLNGGVAVAVDGDETVLTQLHHTVAAL